MSSTVAQALLALRELGTVSALRAGSRSPRLKVNAHIHLPPNFSAFESVQQAVELARAQGIGVLGVSNYYDYDVYGPFTALVRPAGIFPLFGLETIALIDPLVVEGVKINDPGNPGKMYLCGKGITRIAPFSDQAMRILSLIRSNDSTRMAKVVGALDAVLASRGVALGMTEAAVVDMIVKRHGSPRASVYLQERHVCQAFQEALFARVPADQRGAALAGILGAVPKSLEPVAVQNDIRAHLLKSGKPAYVQETFVNFEQAYRLVLELGGIPCYPVLADGTSPICAFEQPVSSLIERLRQRNIHMVEFVPLRNSPQVLRQYVLALRQAGLAVTAGTEHNTLDLLPLEPTCTGGAAVPTDVQEIFWEGACVVAAHQFLTLHGQCGYVDAQGNANSAYGSAQQRIVDLAALGSAVIARYRQTSKP
jgi:hypothetical protein